MRPCWFVVSLCCILVLAFVGCHRTVPVTWDEEAYKLPRRVYGTSDRVVALMVKRFNRGKVIKVISIGSDYLIAFPSSSLFPDQSPRLLWASQGKLHQIVLFLRQFRQVAVTVTCYTSQYVSDRREHALALARAEAVANFIWADGIDSRMIFSQGVGKDKPITNFIQGGDRSPSSRIEITFRDAVI